MDHYFLDIQYHINLKKKNKDKLFIGVKKITNKKTGIKINKMTERRIDREKIKTEPASQH